MSEVHYVDVHMHAADVRVRGVDLSRCREVFGNMLGWDPEWIQEPPNSSTCNTLNRTVRVTVILISTLQQSHVEILRGGAGEEHGGRFFFLHG